MDTAEQKLEHLKMIQEIITRMGNNGFQLKTWGVTLLTALLALVASQPEYKDALVVGLVPALVFWGLDGFFLSKERKFRALYNHVRCLEGSQVENMNYDLNPHGEWVGDTEGWFFSCISRPTLSVFWLSLCGMLGVAYWGVSRIPLPT